MKKVSWLAALVVVLASGSAVAAVPTTMNFTGRLSTSAGPVTTAVTVIFRICPDASTACSASPLWTETHASVTPANGIVYVDLGATAPLDEALFDGTARYMEIVVNGETLTPRMKLNSVPYATRAGVADALGSIIETDVVTTVNGTNGIAASKTANTVAVSLVNCGANQVYKMNAGGTAWACATDADTAPTGSAPIAVASNVISLVNCGANQIYKMNAGGTAWACVNDTAATGTAPIAVSTGNAISLVNCGANQIYKMNAGATAWACATDTDTDTNTTYVAGEGIALSGAIPNVINLSATGCSVGYVWKYQGSGTWACQPDGDTNTTYAAGTGITIGAGSTIGINDTIVARKDSAGGNQAFDSTTLYLDYTTNRVGIGTSMPGQALEVNGTVRALNYEYVSALAGVVHVPSTLCQRTGAGATPYLDTVVWADPGNTVGPAISTTNLAANASVTWVCPVPLNVKPGQTITITGGSMNTYDNNAVCRIQTQLRRRTFLSSGSGTIVSTAFSGTDATDFAFASGRATKTFSAFTPFIFPASEFLFLNVTIAQNSTGGATNDDCRYLGVSIDYTASNP